MTRYELVERIGAGGMAEIFRGNAIAAGGFEKPVAIKRILPHLSQDKRFVELLIAEAHILSHLRNRNIVQIFDVGLGPDGQYFLVMEYVDGADLGHLQTNLEASDQGMSTDLGLYIGSEVCEALEHAHTAPGPDGQPMRLVHRDVSPSNVLLSRSGEVKLTDFGIAKRPEEVTGHGTVRGKFAYISPEQAVNGHVDARSDVFSVGILLFELLLGRRLFSQMADFDALRAVRNASVPRASQVKPDVDPRLDRLLGKALAKNPQDRFASAGELGRALRSLRYSLPVGSGDPAQELSSLIERHAPRKDAVPDEHDSFEEATVVRIKSSHGFSLSMDYDENDASHKSYVDARQIVSSFEEEVTRAVYDPAMFGRHGPDEHGRDDLDDATVDSPAVTGKVVKHNPSDNEATVVGSITRMRRRNTPEESRPTDMINVSPGSLASSGVASGLLAHGTEKSGSPPDRAEWSGEIGGTTSSSDANIDAPTIDRALVSPSPSSGARDLAMDLTSTTPKDSGGQPPVYNTSGSHASSSTAAGGSMSMYPGTYTQAELEEAARWRRKRMLLGIGIGTGVLVLLLIVGLVTDDGEAYSDADIPPDAAPLSIDAGVPIDAAPPDAAAPEKADRSKEKTRKKKTRKRTRKKRTRKKRTRKKKPSSTSK